ncbi:WYL domain-containing protein [Altererythrobacter soli]|uniref:WYL domain-containing protein n=1 Tax=Croceibacterium soli TaxID=1739690 RepID=A0A6I4UWE8_9SPHN|nr:WYL domain-containing protein [Croceibacterium soli]MXP41863.1 WYL domain-containing protein [Croceibacterium soli]
MSDPAKNLRWGAERRLEFIEFELAWEGGVRRSDIRRVFGVSEPQASNDLTEYQRRAPDNAIYDARLKRYVANPSFRPAFLQGAPSEYLLRLRSLAEGIVEPEDSWIGTPPDVDIVLTPAREMDAACLRAVLDAIRARGSLEVRYQSMSRDRPEPIWRRITPHAFGFDGLRWHARAYCHVTECFKDFLLPRILGSRAPDQGGLWGDHDELWQERFCLEITPHPDLGPAQRSVVERDYGMTSGIAGLDVRYAMLFYVLKRLGLLDNPETKPARSQHIVVANKEETMAALNRADWSL